MHVQQARAAQSAQALKGALAAPHVQRLQPPIQCRIRWRCQHRCFLLPLLAVAAAAAASGAAGPGRGIHAGMHADAGGPWCPAGAPCCRLQEGSKHIFHLEAFIARFMSNYKQASGWSEARGRFGCCLAAARGAPLGRAKCSYPASPLPRTAAADRQPPPGLPASLLGWLQYLINVGF